MIVTNIDKARAIAIKHAQRIKSEQERAECLEAIAKATTADEIAAIVQLINLSEGEAAA